MLDVCLLCLYLLLAIQLLLPWDGNYPDYPWETSVSTLLSTYLTVTNIWLIYTLHLHPYKGSHPARKPREWDQRKTRQREVVGKGWRNRGGGVQRGVIVRQVKPVWGKQS